MKTYHFESRNSTLKSYWRTWFAKRTFSKIVRKFGRKNYFLRTISQTVHNRTVQWPHPTINSEGRVWVPAPSTVLTILQVGSPNARMNRRLSAFWKIAQTLFAERKFFKGVRTFRGVFSTKCFWKIWWLSTVVEESPPIHIFEGRVKRTIVCHTSQWKTGLYTTHLG